jgi:hypothetical protein
MLIARGFVFFVVVVGSVALRPDAHKHAPLLAVITLFSISKMAFVALLTTPRQSKSLKQKKKKKKNNNFFCRRGIAMECFFKV